jgi:hypothetical protein
LIGWWNLMYCSVYNEVIANGTTTVQQRAE